MRADRDSVEVLVAIGSNIAPERNVPRAIDLIARKARIAAVSSFYWSEAIGPRRQPRFLNGACRIETFLSARELKDSVLRAIECELGRIRTDDKYAPRPIDLDIALYGNATIHESGLEIPDPYIATRDFLAAPLAEIAADWPVPGLNVTLKEIAAALGTSGLMVNAEVTRIVKEKWETWTYNV